MSIHRLLDGKQSFGPDDIKVLTAAFDDAIKSLGLVNREDPGTLLVAKAIIAAAERGERDATRLRSAALASLQGRESS